MSDITEPIPIINVKSKILLPIKFPTDKDTEPRRIAPIETASSGRLVPRPISSIPIKD